MNQPPDLSALKSKLKKGIFDDELKNETNHLWQTLNGVTDRGENYYKAKSIVSEVSYYFDNINLARQSVEEFQNFEINKCATSDHGLALEKIRCYLAHIQATLYYDHKYERASVKIKECVQFVTEKLARRGSRCSGTLAWANYQLGCCLRQLHLLDEAKQAFLLSISHQGKRARNRKKELERKAKGADPSAGSKETARLEGLAHEELLFCNRRVAIALGLGMGFCDYTRGSLSSARDKVMTAKVLIAHCHDRLNEAYLGLLLGSVIRCRAGSAERQLKTAESTVSQARNLFMQLPHQRYAARASYELALTYLALADRGSCSAQEFDRYLDQAKKEADEVLVFSRERPDPRWISNALVVKSRIERKIGNFGQAIAFANEALEQAGDQRLCQIDAKVARAEANISWVKSDTWGKPELMTANAGESRLSEARIDLDSALALNKKSRSPRSPESQNEKIEAVCRIHIARSYALENNQVQASIALKELSGIERLEHKKIVELWRKVKAEISEITKEFTFDWSAEQIDYDELVRKLESFVVSIANQKHSTNQAARAKFLKMARTNYINLEKRVERETSA